jgi:hypothetical protein
MSYENASHIHQVLVVGSKDQGWGDRGTMDRACQWFVFVSWILAWSFANSVKIFTNNCQEISAN